MLTNRRSTVKYFYKVSLPGFSLVEVTIALGILAVVILPILAMLPLGLEMQRTANQGTIEAQILQRLTGHYAATEFSALKEIALGGSETWFFDVDGQEVKETSNTRIYDARVTVQIPLLVPGSSAGGASSIANYSAAGLLVEIANNPGQLPNIFDDPKRDHGTKFSVLYRNDSQVSP